TLATSIFGMSLLANVYLIAFNGIFSSDTSPLEATVAEGSPAQKIAVIPVEGVITSHASQQIALWLRSIEKDANVKAVVLAVDTPGGYVTPSDEIYHHVTQLKKNRGIPVAVAMGAMATSGGYYLSAGADQIFAQPTTITGNIGVLMPRFNVSEMV